MSVNLKSLEAALRLYVAFCMLRSKGALDVERLDVIVTVRLRKLASELTKDGLVEQFPGLRKHADRLTLLPTSFVLSYPETQVTISANEVSLERKSEGTGDFFLPLRLLSGTLVSGELSISVKLRAMVEGDHGALLERLGIEIIGSFEDGALHPRYCSMKASLADLSLLVSLSSIAEQQIATSRTSGTVVCPSEGIAAAVVELAKQNWGFGRIWRLELARDAIQTNHPDYIVSCLSYLTGGARLVDGA